MSKKGNLTRAEVIAIVGEAAVTRLERAGCEATNRVQCDGDDFVEFAAEISSEDANGDAVKVVAFYYQPASVTECEDLESLEWQIEGYEVR